MRTNHDTIRTILAAWEKWASVASREDVPIVLGRVGEALEEGGYLDANKEPTALGRYVLGQVRLSEADIKMVRWVAAECVNGPDCSGACECGWCDGGFGQDQRRAVRLNKLGFLEGGNSRNNPRRTEFHISAVGRSLLRHVSPPAPEPAA